MTIKDISVILIISLGISACTGLNSAINSFGRNVDALFSSSRIVENKIINPFLPDAKLAALWIGHATLLIQIDDKFILTDPHLISTGAMISKRLVEPGIDPNNLPELDVVVISHLHVDHLSHGSIGLIEDKIKDLIVPEKASVYLPNLDTDVSELKIWESWEKDGLKITATPIIHNGWRYGIDAAWMNVSYSAFVIEYNGIKVYFGGDTAYDDKIFVETGKRFENIDLALLPVAPIHPREYSKARHTDPVEAIKIFRDLGAKSMTPMHFDTFCESYDTLGEASALLREEMVKQNLTEKEIIILEIGEQKVYK